MLNLRRCGGEKRSWLLGALLKLMESGHSHEKELRRGPRARVIEMKTLMMMMTTLLRGVLRAEGQVMQKCIDSQYHLEPAAVSYSVEQLTKLRPTSSATASSVQ